MGRLPLTLGETRFGGAKCDAAISSPSSAARPVWPFRAQPQPAGKVLTIGFLGGTTPATSGNFLASFLRRLRDLGWVDGRNIALDVRWAEGRPERAAEIAAEFVRLNVQVIVAGGGTPTVLAAKRAASVIPIVFTGAGDPVEAGLVASLARPGGNVTGLSTQTPDLAGKRLELLREAVPGLRRWGSSAPPTTLLQYWRWTSFRQLCVPSGCSPSLPKFGAAGHRFAFEVMRGRVDAIYVVTDTLVNTNGVRINTFALAERLPTTYGIRDIVELGGLMSYGANCPDLYRRTADFVDKILRGTKPAEIPVEQPTKFDLIVNVVTAKAIGLTIPESFLARADEVIE